METTCKCENCNRTPDQIEEYVDLARELGCSPVEAVRREEGTYNPTLDLFCCTDCYIMLGMPLGRAGAWRRSE